MKAQEAYKDWKGLTKINMAVYTDEQMFVIGYRYRDEEVAELIQLIKDQAKRLEELKPKESNVKKSKKA